MLCVDGGTARVKHEICQRKLRAVYNITSLLDQVNRRMVHITYINCGGPNILPGHPTM